MFLLLLALGGFVAFLLYVIFLDDANEDVILVLSKNDRKKGNEAAQILYKKGIVVTHVEKRRREKVKRSFGSR